MLLTPINYVVYLHYVHFSLFPKKKLGYILSTFNETLLPVADLPMRGPHAFFKIWFPISKKIFYCDRSQNHDPLMPKNPPRNQFIVYVRMYIAA